MTTATKEKLQASTSPLVQLTKLLILFINDKGGVGKSTIVNAAADVITSTDGRTVHRYDTDGTNGSFLKRHGLKKEDGNPSMDQDPKNGVGYFDLSKDGQRDEFLNCLGRGADIVMMDIGAKALEQMTKVVDDGDGVSGLIKAIHKQGYQIVILHVLSNLAESTASVKAYLNAFESNAKHIAIVNKAWGKDDKDFPFWYGHEDAETGKRLGFKTRDDLLGKFGGKEIIFPALNSGTYAKVAASTMTYKEAEHSPRMTITEQAHLSKFNEAALEALLEVKEYIGL